MITGNETLDVLGVCHSYLWPCAWSSEWKSLHHLWILDWTITPLSNHRPTKNPSRGIPLTLVIPKVYTGHLLPDPNQLPLPCCSCLIINDIYDGASEMSLILSRQFFRFSILPVRCIGHCISSRWNIPSGLLPSPHTQLHCGPVVASGRRIQCRYT